MKLLNDLHNLPMSRIIFPLALDPWGLVVVLKWNIRVNVKMFRFQYFCVSFYTNVKINAIV